MDTNQDKLSLTGMRCAACAQLIEYRIRQLPGVSQFEVQLSSHSANLSWDPERISLKNILDAIIRLGYGALPAGQSHTEALEQSNRIAIWRIFIAGFAMMQVMMYAFPAYLEPVPAVDGDLTPAVDLMLKLASLALTLPVVLFSAWPFYKSAWRDLSNRHLGMDVPVSLGIILSFLASLWATFKGGAVYYDSVIMFVFLLLGARFVEDKVQQKTRAALTAITSLVPQFAQRLLAYPEQRQTTTIALNEVQAGDYLLVPAGANFPADALIVEGASSADESLMTGEAKPVTKQVGDKVLAGSVNILAPIIIRAQEVAGKTQLAHIIAMMEQAASHKPALVMLADKHASRFLSIILIIAVLTAVVWWQLDSSRALWIAISVIVVTCPCALSLATPGVMAAAIGYLAKHGVLMTKAKALQGLATADCFVFDKTGTLTQAQLSVVETICLNQQTHDLELALSLANLSQHPVSRAIVEWRNVEVKESDVAANIPAWQHIQESAGHGVLAYYQGQEYRLGKQSFIEEMLGHAILVPPHLSGKSLSFFANQQACLVIFALEDQLREEAQELVRELQRERKRVLILSGDRHAVVAELAQRCGITEAYGELSPEQKFDFLRNLQAEGKHVVMIGDGMNDGPALALAEVSIAMGSGAPISQTRSDIILLSNRLSDLSLARQVTIKALTLIKENLAWAVLYNLLAIPAAVMGYLEPWHAALGMSLSSVIVVANALRVVPRKQKVG